MRRGGAASGNKRENAVYNISAVLKNEWIPESFGMFTVADGYRYRRIDRNDF